MSTNAPTPITPTTPIARGQADERPARRFRTILADPPWDIQQKGARGAEHHYSLMTLERIKRMPVAQLADIRDIAQRQAAVAAVAALNVQRHAQLAGLEVSSDAQVTMSLNDVRVNWGGIDEGPLKAAVVAALVERSGIRTLDVRAPQRPVATG